MEEVVERGLTAVEALPHVPAVESLNSPLIHASWPSLPSDAAGRRSASADDRALARTAGGLDPTERSVFLPRNESRPPGSRGALRMRSSFSFTCSMMTVALANALGRLMRPFASVDLVSRPIFVPFYLRQSIQPYTIEGLRSSGIIPPAALEIAGSTPFSPRRRCRYPAALPLPPASLRRSCGVAAYVARR